jgi:predicted O-methyltransferase YrrM
MSAQEIANELNVSLRGITILLNALVAMGLLEKKYERFSCPTEAASLLSKDSPTSIMPMLMHSAALWRRWSALTDIVRQNTDVSRPSAPEYKEWDQEAFIGAMHVIASQMAPSIVAAIKPGAAKKLIDIGGASGTYTQAFLEACPDMRATLFDLPPVIEMARRRLSGTDLIGRITLVAGDFYTDELPAGHDLAFLSAIIHQNSTEQNLTLYRKIYRSLEPGGRLVIRDHIMSRDRTKPVSGALFAVNMLVVTQGGCTYTFEEIHEALKAAGFINIHLIQQDERMNGLVEGFRP